MIPLKDSVRPRRTPYVNISLIIINILIFVYTLGLSQSELIQLFYLRGVIPRQFVLSLLQDRTLEQTWLPLFTSTFLHGGWLHLLGNMLYLWVFGDNVEDRLGHGGYLLFYLAAGVAGSFAHISGNTQSAIPTIGASGAIAGVLGVYLLFFPRARVLTLIPIGFFLTTARLPATLFLFIWFILQLLNASLAGLTAGAQTVAWWAHIGGFIFGFIIGLGAHLKRKVF
ncbi:MAG: rhomboid family intramembrane serine protease [Bacillota bacterium]